MINEEIQLIVCDEEKISKIDIPACQADCWLLWLPAQGEAVSSPSEVLVLVKK